MGVRREKHLPGLKANRTALRRPCAKVSAQLRTHFAALTQRLARSDFRPLNAPWVIGVSSLIDRAGKSTVAFNLAATWAEQQQQPVLLVEANLGLSYSLAGRQPRVSFRQVLEGAATTAEALIRDPAWPMDIVPSQRLVPRDVENLPWELFPRIVREQMLDYQVILVDLPSAAHRAFPWIVSGMQGLILVLEERELQLASIERFQSRWSDAEWKLLGIVVNKCR